jgi:hypothetical protein
LDFLVLYTIKTKIAMMMIAIKTSLGTFIILMDMNLLRNSFL